jgi:hypothetical protein
VRELVYLSRTKLDAFAPRGGLLGRIKPGTVDVSVPGVSISANASLRTEESDLPWDRLKTVEKDLRKTAVELDNPHLEPGLWLRFHLPMVWTVPVDSSLAFFNRDLVLFASADTAGSPGVRLLLCGSKGHLLADRGATPVTWGASDGRWLEDFDSWATNEERALEQVVTERDAEDHWSLGFGLMQRSSQVYDTVVRNIPSQPARLSGYARVLGHTTQTLPRSPDQRGIGEPRVERFILATPLVVDYAPLAKA